MKKSVEHFKFALTGKPESETPLLLSDPEVRQLLDIARENQVVLIKDDLSTVNALTQKLNQELGYLEIPDGFSYAVLFMD